MKMEAWWFENRQTPEEILQPEMAPKTQFGVYCEVERISYPFALCVTAVADAKELYRREFVIESNSVSGDGYEADCSGSALHFSCVAENAAGLPDELLVELRMEGALYIERIPCEYARIYGKITDFDGRPFPAPVIFARQGFAGSSIIGAWSDKNGNYSVIVPKGCYNSVFVDDNSYGTSTLENWSWHMIIDRDEEHNFKVGNAEVYSLSVWSNNGGSSTLFFWFRPMLLPSIRKKEYEIELNGKKCEVMDICPELAPADISVTLNGAALKVLSLQKVYETGGDHSMPSYVVQTERPGGSAAIGKQTAVVEYDTAKRCEELGYTARSQGRCQFYFMDDYALSLQ